MIVRILGEGQFDVPDADRAVIEELGDVLTAAVDGHDEAGFAPSLANLIEAVRRIGTELPPDSFTSSDLVVPFSDATLTETEALLEEPGGERT